jgi:hypothetical protein
MAKQFSTTKIGEPPRREELEALLEIVPEFTVGSLKQLYKKLTGEITRSNNKPSLRKRVTAEIARLLEETGNDGETDINTNDAHDEIPSEDAPEDETTIEYTDNTESDAMISADTEEHAESEKEPESTAIENVEIGGSEDDDNKDNEDLPSGADEQEQREKETEKTKPTAKPKKQRERDPRLPPAGTVLSREYKGECHEVTVLEEGFMYNGEHFRSLSKIAKHICCGVSWNGFLFFRAALQQASPNQ